MPFTTLHPRSPSGFTVSPSFFLRAQLKPRQLVNQLKGTDSLCDFWRWVRFYDNSIIFNRLNRLKQVWRPYVYFGFASLRLKRSIKSKERIHFAILFILRLYHISRVLYKFTQGFSAKEIRNKSNTFICLAISIYKLALMIIKSIKPKLHLDSK
jgi:hypothetical protein